MLRGQHIGIFATVALAIANASCTSGECGEGTVRFGDRCVVSDPFDKTPPAIEVTPPLYTRQVGVVQLTANEPATIYYTIDGSTPTLESPNEQDRVAIAGVPDNAQLRYFAVDVAGNQSDEESRIWVIDREGPGAPLDFKVAVTNSTRTVSWTPATDPRPGGVVVARVEGALVAPPTGGNEYKVGDVLSPGVTIVHIQTAAQTGPASTMETVTSKPGLVRYVAWAYDNLFNYGPPAGDHVVTPIPAQTGRLIVGGNGTVTTMMAPSFISFTGTATLVGSVLTAKITMKNETTRVLYAPKVLIKNAVPSWNNEDGTFATFPYRAFGAAILPNAGASATFTFTGASAATMITLDVDVRDNTILMATLRDDFTAGYIVDFATGEEVLQLSGGVTGQGGGAMTTRGGITPDGRLVVGARTNGSVSVFDLSTGKRLLAAQLRPQKSHVPQVVIDKGGAAAYALVAEGHPNSTNQNGGSNTELVRLDTATLSVSGRIPIDISRNRDIVISPDGKTLFVATGITAKGVVVVDLTTFTLKQRITPGFRAQTVLFTLDGSSLIAVGEQIAIYRASDLMRTAIYPAPGTLGKVLRAAFSSANILWVGRRDQTGTIDIRDGTTVLFPTLQGRMLEFFDGKMYTGNGNTISRVDLTGTVETTLPGFQDLNGHWLGRSPF